MVYLNSSYEKVWYGEKVVSNNIIEAIKMYNPEKILIVTTESITTTDSFENLVRLCSNYQPLIYKSKAHVPIDKLFAKFHEVKSYDPDLIISVGGGSSIDSAKIWSAILSFDINSKDELVSYALNKKRTQQLKQETVPHIAIPTTLSAAEFSGVGGFSDISTKMKYGISHISLTPKQIFLDPTFSVELPIDFWISTGIRAVDHAVETVYSTKESPVNQSLALDSLTYLFRYLPLVKDKPENLDYRLQCQLGAWMSFFSIVNTKMGLSHMIGHQLGSFYGIPHGLTSAIMLPNVMEFLLPYSEKKQAIIYKRLNEAGLANKVESVEEMSRGSSGLVRNLVNKLELPSRLREFQVSEDTFGIVVQNIISEIKIKEYDQLLCISDLEYKLSELLKKSW